MSSADQDDHPSSTNAAAMTLQDALQAVTQHLPAPLPALGASLLGDECYTSLIWAADLSRTDCLRLAISKALGIGIIVFGSILKLPQMATIIRHKSAHGVSLAMYALEVVAYDISLAYAYRRRLPFSTYGENASLTLQNMVITLLIMWYGEGGKGRLTRHAGDVSVDYAKHREDVPAAAAAMATGSLFLFKLCPPSLLAVLQALSIPISCISKLPQIAELHRNGETGHLSSIVVFAQLAGTLARVFTTVTETGDWLIGLGFGLASILNAVIAVQYVYYWKGNASTFSQARRLSGVLPLTGRHRQQSGLYNGSSPRHPSSRAGSHAHARDMSQSLMSISIDGTISSGDSAYSKPCGSNSQPPGTVLTPHSGRAVHEKGSRAD